MSLTPPSTTTATAPPPATTSVGQRNSEVARFDIYTYARKTSTQELGTITDSETGIEIDVSALSLSGGVWEEGQDRNESPTLLLSEAAGTLVLAGGRISLRTQDDDPTQLDDGVWEYSIFYLDGSEVKKLLSGKWVVQE